MTQQGSSFGNSRGSLDRVMEPEQFDQVIEAILAGKYSWACVLILQFGGYNPLHYIPYRTYNRIMKDHCQAGRKKAAPAPASMQKPAEAASNRYGIQRKPDKIHDLSYLEVVNEPRTQVKGGTLQTLEQWLNKRVQEIYSLKKVELKEHRNYRNQSYQSLFF